LRLFQGTKKPISAIELKEGIVSNKNGFNGSEPIELKQGHEVNDETT
jgi:hypothetical protein